MNELSSLGARTGARSVEATAAPRGVFLQRLLARVRARPEWVCMPLTLVLFIGGWEWYVTAHKVSSLILPPPSDIVTALYSGFANGVYVNALYATLQAIVLGFLLAASVAFILGTLISQVRLLEATIYPYVVALQTLPKIAIAPLILVWVGLGIESKIIIATRVRLVFSNAGQHHRRAQVRPGGQAGAHARARRLAHQDLLSREAP